MASDLRLYRTPPGIIVDLFARIPDGEARGYRLPLAEGWFDGFLVRRGDAVRGYVDRCPHAGVALTRYRRDYLSAAGDRIACQWHGAAFRIEDGACIAGPCGGLGLDPWPLTVADELIVTT